MKFTIIRAEEIIDPTTFVPKRRIVLEYSALEAKISGTVITSQDEYDLMVGSELRDAMNNFIKWKRI